MHIHLEGMGVLGSVLAHTLHHAGHAPFTWHDNNDPLTAWRSSTATILPSAGDDLSYGLWSQAPTWLEPYIERGAYWYHSKLAPGSNTIEHDLEAPVARRHRRSSLHVNMRRFVLDTRAKFEDQRITNKFDDPLVIRTHGFTDATHYLWGWSAYATIDTTLPCGLRRPCLYGRATRYELAYAYPWPATKSWRIGSDLISTKTRRTRGDHFDACMLKWRDRMQRMFGDAVTISEMHSPEEGWRPMGPEEHARVTGAHDDRFDEPLVRRESPKLWRLVPMGRFGVRWALAAATEVLQELERV